MTLLPQSDGLAVYVHWPFCRSKCPYCDFNSHVADGIDHAAWRDALVREIDHAAQRSPTRAVSSIFFGGGTPSLMPPQTTAAVIDRIAARWRVAEDVEITLEANPTSAEAQALADMARAGVNRISLGVQALDDRALGFLGREHSAREALDAVAVAHDLVPRVSFDLIYGRPGQTVAAWRAELWRALNHAGGHISAYQLTIEKGTPFYAAHRGGDFALPDPDTGAALYEATRTMLDDAGLPAYEISNHARPGEQCRHNLAYWQYRDHVGIGPGAHGRIVVDGVLRAIENVPGPEHWRREVVRRGHGARRDEPLARADMIVEMLMMGLRLTDGVDGRAFAARCGARLEDAIAPADLDAMVHGGLLERDGTRLKATRSGQRVLDGIVERLSTRSLAGGLEAAALADQKARAANACGG